MSDWLASISTDTVDRDGWKGEDGWRGEGSEERSIDRSLVIGAAIVEELRAAVYKETGFRCSAGIAHNKAEIYIIIVDVCFIKL